MEQCLYSWGFLGASSPHASATSTEPCKPPCGLHLPILEPRFSTGRQQSFCWASALETEWCAAWPESESSEILLECLLGGRVMWKEPTYFCTYEVVGSQMPCELAVGSLASGDAPRIRAIGVPYQEKLEGF